MISSPGTPITRTTSSPGPLASRQGEVVAADEEKRQREEQKQKTRRDKRSLPSARREPEAPGHKRRRQQHTDNGARVTDGRAETREAAQPRGGHELRQHRVVGRNRELVGRVGEHEQGEQRDDLERFPVRRRVAALRIFNPRDLYGPQVSYPTRER